MSAADLLEASGPSSEAQTGTSRRLLVTWQHPNLRKIQPIGFLTYDSSSYGFEYIRNVTNVEDFRPLLGFPELERRYVSDTLFPLFAQRAMDPRRPDYERYVTRLGLDADTTPWEQIARSGGRRQGDTLQLLPEPIRAGTDLTCAFLVHGIRWIGSRPMVLDGREIMVSRTDVEQALGDLHPGDELRLISEPANPSNRLAIVVTSGNQTPLGYVPDVLLDDLQRLRRVSSTRVTVEVANGPGAPWHLRLMARLEAANVGDFRFFTGSSWLPLHGKSN